MTKKIMWDKGHGGSDPGAVGNGLQEADLTNKIVDYGMAYLSSNYTGFEQRATRAKGETLELMKRDDEADAWGADVFVSVHINAGKGKGFESFIYNGRVTSSTITLQNMIHSEVLAAMRKFGNIIDRGKKRANFAVLRETNMDAVLTESLFIDSSDSSYLKNESFIKDVGEAHARGVAKFLGLPIKSKSQPKPTSTADSTVISKPSVVYEAHVQSKGWQGSKKDGQTAGTTGKSLRLEALTVRLRNTDADLEMEGHVQGVGWTSLRTNGEVIGTIGESLRLEAIKLKAKGLNIQYRVHVEKDGWSAWKKNGEVAGTTGQSKRIEAIQIKLA